MVLKNNLLKENKITLHTKDTIVDDINEEKNEEKTVDIDEIIRLLQEEQNKPNQTLNKNDNKNDSKRKKHSENKDGE